MDVNAGLKGPIAPPAPVLSEISKNDNKNNEQPISTDDGVSLMEKINPEERRAIFKKIYGSKKKPSIRAKERRLRQNKKLRKSLVPKAALQTLYELKGVNIGDFQVTQSPGGGFNCCVNINNIQYQGFGSTGVQSKNSCCEKAIRDLILQRLMNAKYKGGSETNNENNAGAEAMEVDEEEDVPMLNLASYALHKLFAVWENEGFDVPDLKKGGETEGGEEGERKLGPPKSELPENAATLHPTTLLCLMRPGTTYETVEVVGQSPNITTKVKVSVDGQEYFGVARSKKLARRDAAVKACNSLFGTKFEGEPAITA